MHHFLFELANPIGIIGVILILIAYLYLSTGRWASNTILYQSLNFIGAWLILYSLMFYWNLASVLIEIAWIIISVIGMYRVVAEKKK